MAALLCGLHTLTAQVTNYVALTGSDASPGTLAAPWRTLQFAANVAPPGSTVLVLPGTYNEKVTVNVSGSAAAGFITFQAASNVVVSGAGIIGSNLFYLRDRSWVRIIGFELRDNLAVTNGSGIRLEGAGDHLEVRDCRIHEIRGADAMGITVYGTALTPLANIVLLNNEVFDCDPAPSEAVTLNGNVTNFQVHSNYVHDVNNIGLDFIGGEGMCPDPAQDAARNGSVRWNRVARARSNYGGGYGAGIYVDGGRDIVVENNRVTESDLGIEVGAEQPGALATNVTVRSNLIYRNDKPGLIFGGYAAGTGRVRNCAFLNNTLYQNDTLRTGDGELVIQFADTNLVQNNLIWANSQNLMLKTEAAASGNVLDYNLWFSDGATNLLGFRVAGTLYSGFGSYRMASGQDAHSLVAAPQLAAPASADFQLSPTSPARNAGNPAYAPAVGESDAYGRPRRFEGRVDLGAAEVFIAPTLAPPTRQPDGSARVLLNADPGVNYELQVSTDLRSWTSLGTNAATTTNLTFADPVTGLSRRYYRALAQP